MAKRAKGTKLKLDMRNAALSLGLLFAVLHLAGALLIILTNGAAIGYVQYIHFLRMQTQYSGFTPTILVEGMVTAFIIGAFIGALFAWIWNRVSRY